MKRVILSLYLFLLSLSVLFAFPLVAYAADEDIGTNVCRSVTKNQAECQNCFNGGGAWTAVGCLGKSTTDSGTSSVNDFLKSFLSIGIGAGGGIAFLLILFSGFQTMTSAGNPEKLHAAKELMTAAISGLFLIIFSIFLLKLIGVDILQIPGFGSP